MLSELKNSIKAKLYDFTYTPFLSSVFISWIIINHKYLLIYFGESSIKDKLLLLNDYNTSISVMNKEIPYSLNFILPILFGLFYVFLYPWISKIFYEYTLKRTKELRKIKQQIEDETPLTRKEARFLIQENRTLIQKLEECEEKYIELKQFNDNSYSNDKKEIFVDLSTETTDIDKGEDDLTKILRYFYESNYKPKNESKLLDSIVRYTKLARPKAKKIFNQLIDENILSIDNSGFKLIHITDKGNDLLLDLFDKGGEKQ